MNPSSLFTYPGSPLGWGFPPPALTAVVPALVVAVGAGVAGRDPEEPAVLRRLLAVGFIGAGLSYAPYVLTPGVAGATRTQILSAPWIAIFLASLLDLAARRLGTARRVVMALAGAWVVFIGASHMGRMQNVWDHFGKFEAQRSSLSQLLAKVPDTKPHTLILLVGETQVAWPMSWGFRHAVAYLYDDRAVGTVAATDDRPYPVSFGPRGIAVTPWASIQIPWRQPATVYGYDEVIVAAASPTGAIEVLPDWPGAGLPGLPASATYQPLSRIVRDGPAIASRAVLRQP